MLKTHSEKKKTTGKKEVNKKVRKKNKRREQSRRGGKKKVHRLHTCIVYIICKAGACRKVVVVVRCELTALQSAIYGDLLEHLSRSLWALFLSNCNYHTPRWPRPLLSFLTPRPSVISPLECVANLWQL